MLNISVNLPTKVHGWNNLQIAHTSEKALLMMTVHPAPLYTQEKRLDYRPCDKIPVVKVI